MTPQPAGGLRQPGTRRRRAHVVATLDSSKWGVLGLRSFCATRDIGVVVTEAEPDADTVDALQQAGTRLTVAA